MKRDTCQRCGYVHRIDDSSAVNRFSDGPKMFIAKHGETQRNTRQEAENDECTWRINNKSQTEASAPVHKNTIPAEITEKQTVQFPAAMVEVAAREKAWLEFLAHVNFSLAVWQVDRSIHGLIESPIAWLKKCNKELNEILMPNGYRQ